MQTSEDDDIYVQYSSFSIGNEDDLYKLNSVNWLLFVHQWSHNYALDVATGWYRVHHLIQKNTLDSENAYILVNI